MDLERRRQAASEAKRVSRLIEEEELPQWLVKDEDEVRPRTFITVGHRTSITVGHRTLITVGHRTSITVGHRT